MAEEEPEAVTGEEPVVSQPTRKIGGTIESSAAATPRTSTCMMSPPVRPHNTASASPPSTALSAARTAPTPILMASASLAACFACGLNVAEPNGLGAQDQDGPANARFFFRTYGVPNRQIRRMRFSR